jgi:hypothetical protein
MQMDDVAEQRAGWSTNQRLLVRAKFERPTVRASGDVFKKRVNK